MIIALSFFISLSLVLLDQKFNTGNSFIHNFIELQSVTIMGVILAINCASASSIYLKIIEQEEKVNDDTIYKETKTQIRHNIVFLVVSFVVAIATMFICSILKSCGLNAENICLGSDTVVLTIFNLYIYALYELTVRIVFKIPSLTTKE